MSDEQHQIKKQIDKYDRLYRNTQGGIFQKKTRKKILTKEGILERSPAKNTFWYRQRENVKTTLIDLQLFVEEAGEKNVEQVFNEKALKPLVDVLLDFSYLSLPVLRKAEIARLFIKAGFECLSSIHHNNLTVSHQNTIHEAIDLSDYLAESLKPRDERQYPSYKGM